MNTGRLRGDGLGAPVAALFVALLIVVTIFVYASFSPKQVASTSSPIAPTSTTEASTLHSSSIDASNISTIVTSTTTASTVSRIADNQSTYPANETLSNSVTTSTQTNSTNTCAISGSATGECAGTECPPMSIGRPMQLQVVSDIKGTPVQGTAQVSAVVETGCHGMNINVQETLYFDKVSQGPSGWFDLPNILGAFNLTVSYGGHTYLFRTGSDPGSTTCLVLAVPSGVVNLAVYQFSNYDCAGNLLPGAGQSTYSCFGEVYLRVLSDPDSVPVGGANVTTAYDFPTTCVDSPSPCSYLSCGEAFKSFTTTSTEWYAFGDSTNSFNVTYGGQTYVVTASQGAGSTCETLHVPSGTVDTAYGPGCVAGEPSTTTSTSTTVNSSTSSVLTPCGGGGLNTVLNPAPKGTVYVKVVTDQGTVITNGSLMVSQYGNTTNGYGTAHYCISLSDVNGTGYLQLAALNGTNTAFLESGHYDVTLMAGYNNQVPWFNAAIPSIQVHPNSTVYVTVSVPSGVVTVVTSNEGSSAVTATTSATTSTSTNENQISQYDCGGVVYKLTPVQNATLFLKLVTSQGAAITNNGTVFVFHTAPNGDGYYGGTGEYCLALNGNATGYMGLTSNDGLAPIGSYGLTLFVGSVQAPAYRATIPPITVPPDTTVSVTVAVPSGEVTVLSCTQGSSCTTSTFVVVGG
jgi:hypothetical protein